MKIKHIISAILIFIILLGTLSVTTSAKSSSYAPYYSYELDKNDKSVAAPVGFIESKTANSVSLGLDTNMDAPQDMVVKNGSFYILDSTNSRILELDENLKLKKIYSDFLNENNEKIEFAGATGFDVDRNNNFVIADTDNLRILILNKNGKLLKQILKPEAVLEDNEFPFRASKIKCAEDGNIYVTVETMNLGIFVFDENGNFDKFVANNPVVATADVIMNYLYRAILTTEQIRNRMQATPLKVYNFCIDNNGFIYTVSQSAYSTKQTGMVRCMNYRDSNIINSEIVFGDVEQDPKNEKTLFNSIAITAESDYVLLDTGRGKVFYYSSNGYLISVFGAYGDQKGTFNEPKEVRYYNDKIYVLDAGKNCVIEFSPTKYVDTYKEALKLLKERKFEDSLEKWNEIVLLNSNSRYAYYGMGLVHDMKGDFKTAMDCFKLADNRTAYSNSFKEYRAEWMEENVFLIILVLVLIIAVIVAVVLGFKRLQATNGTAFSIMERKSLFPLYTLRHPVDGFEQFKLRDVASFKIAFSVLIVWFVTEIVSKYAKGFIYSPINSDFNPLSIVASTFGLFAIFVASNWSVASFNEGKGTFKDITVSVAYSLIPYVLSRIITIPLTNILTAEEAVFITIISAIGLMWSGVLLLGALYAIHQYSFSKMLLSLLLTIVGMLIILLVMVIFASLLQQVFGFLDSLYTEITL